MPANASPLPDFDALWNYDDPAATEATFQEVLAGVADAAGIDYLAELHSQIGRTFGLRRDFAAAHAWIDKADGLCNQGQAMGATMCHPRVRVLLERGRTYNSGGEPATAVPLFMEAMNLAQAAGLERLAIDAVHMLGIAVPGEGGLDWNRKAIRMAEAATDPSARRWLGSLYHNTAWSLHELERYDEALDLFQKGLAFREAQGQAGQIGIMRWCVARCLRSLGRYDEALGAQEALAAEFAADGDDDGYVHEELGELFLLLDRPADATPQFAKAYTLLSQDPSFPPAESARLARLKALGERRG